MWCAPLVYSSGDDDMADLLGESTDDGDVGFYAWVTQPEQVRDAHLIEDVWVRVYPNVKMWPGLDVDILVGEHKEVKLRCDIVLSGVSMPSRFPDPHKPASHYDREQRRGEEAIAFIRHVISVSGGDLYLTDVRADGAGRFLADVHVILADGTQRYLNDVLVKSGHGVYGEVYDWGARRVREVK